MRPSEVGGASDQDRLQDPSSRWWPFSGENIYFEILPFCLQKVTLYTRRPQYILLSLTSHWSHEPKHHIQRYLFFLGYVPFCSTYPQAIAKYCTFFLTSSLVSLYADKTAIRDDIIYSYSFYLYGLLCCLFKTVRETARHALLKYVKEMHGKFLSSIGCTVFSWLQAVSLHRLGLLCGARTVHHVRNGFGPFKSWQDYLLSTRQAAWCSWRQLSIAQSEVTQSSLYCVSFAAPALTWNILKATILMAVDIGLRDFFCHSCSTCAVDVWNLHVRTTGHSR